MQLKERDKLTNNNTWDYLYKLDKPLRKKRDFNHLKELVNKELKSYKDCTFSPQITKNLSHDNKDVYERTMEWKNKHNRL